jgi:hypothetical protein
MSKYFEINGFWKDDKSTFDGYIVREYDDLDEELDDLIFYYGLGESELNSSSEDDALEFVVTSFEEVERDDLI